MPKNSTFQYQVSRSKRLHSQVGSLKRPWLYISSIPLLSSKMKITPLQIAVGFNSKTKAIMEITY